MHAYRPLALFLFKFDPKIAASTFEITHAGDVVLSFRAWRRMWNPLYVYWMYPECISVRYTFSIRNRRLHRSTLDGHTARLDFFLDSFQLTHLHILPLDFIKCVERLFWLYAIWNYYFNNVRHAFMYFQWIFMYEISMLIRIDECSCTLLWWKIMIDLFFTKDTTLWCICFVMWCNEMKKIKITRKPKIMNLCTWKITVMLPQ